MGVREGSVFGPLFLLFIHWRLERISVKHELRFYQNADDTQMAFAIMVTQKIRLECVAESEAGSKPTASNSTMEKIGWSVFFLVER